MTLELAQNAFDCLNGEYYILDLAHESPVCGISAFYVGNCSDQQLKEILGKKVLIHSSILQRYSETPVASHPTPHFKQMQTKTLLS